MRTSYEPCWPKPKLSPCVFAHGRRREKLEALLQVLCRGQCYVPGSIAVGAGMVCLAFDSGRES